MLVLAVTGLVACGGGSDGEADDQPKIKLQQKKSSASDKENADDADAVAEDPEATAMENKGIGPIDKLELAAIDEGLVAEGEELFNKNCTACHKVEKRYIGPAVAGVTDRRTPEWIMNMMLNPTEMIAKDPLTKKLVSEYNGAVMANQNLSEEEARAILEYFRTL